MEELPSDTVVEGTFASYTDPKDVADLQGHYRALLWDEGSRSWQEDQDLGIHVAVEVSLVLHSYPTYLSLFTAASSL